VIGAGRIGTGGLSPGWQRCPGSASSLGSIDRLNMKTWMNIYVEVFNDLVIVVSRSLPGHCSITLSALLLIPTTTIAFVSQTV
jgi:hypothetical protein